MSKITPMMEQYFKIKNNYSDSILFFRLGDFYEMFFEDAIVASRELEITLTSRDYGMKDKAPMCGIPHHSANPYISKLIEKGFKVAICEQLEEASQAKGVVKRDVVRVITSGTIIDVDSLDKKTSNYIAIVYLENNNIGIAHADTTTGKIYTTEFIDDCNLTLTLNELGKISPKEILINFDINNKNFERFNNLFFNITIKLDHSFFNETNIEKNLLAQFSRNDIKSIDLRKNLYSLRSVSSLIEYLKNTQKQSLEHINYLNFYNIDNFMKIDINSRLNLELLETVRTRSKKGSLLSILDETLTAMGGRLIRKWIEEPLLNIDDINYRNNIVEFFLSSPYCSDQINILLKKIYDLERLLSKLIYANCNARDMIALKKSLSNLPKLKKILSESKNENIVKLIEDLDPLDDIFKLLCDSIEDDPPISITEGHIIKKTFDNELSDIREITINGKHLLFELEQREKEKTTIKNLKVGYNRIFGYFIELSKSNIDKAPAHYIRKQTLANSERYITDELKEIEEKILNAEDKMILLEYDLFNKIKDLIKIESYRIQKTSHVIAKIDVLLSFSKVAHMNNYISPKLVNTGEIMISDGRHPVVETMVKNGNFISNDTSLDLNNNRTMIITGPNMSGKSTYMRQVALISLMAQIGSFVPASKATISLVDQIFTRIGASDDLSEGDSTFMVEMKEVSNILLNATNSSLIILDEIGRGTSTYDGLSIAWSVIEHINNPKNIGAKTLFATHYHELTKLESEISGINNYRINVKEEPNKNIVFLRKVERGSALKSYGIEVAKLAGISKEVIQRAYNILESLENKESYYRSNSQISLFNHDSFSNNNNHHNKNDEKKLELISKIKEIDMMTLTPMESMNILYEIWKKLKDI